MGDTVVDKFSFLHFIVGILFYAINIDFSSTFLLHTLFELFENSAKGIIFIDTYLPFWPGGKKKADSIINTISDTIINMLGWGAAKMLKTDYKIKKSYLLIFALISIFAYIEVRKTIKVILHNAKN